MADMTAAEAAAIRARIANDGGPVVDGLMSALRDRVTAAAARNRATASVQVPTAFVTRFVARVVAAGFTVDRTRPGAALTGVAVRWGADPTREPAPTE